MKHRYLNPLLSDEAPPVYARVTDPRPSQPFMDHCIVLLMLETFCYYFAQIIESHLYHDAMFGFNSNCWGDPALICESN